MTAFVDDFNRANGSLGGNWVPGSAAGTTSATIVSNKVRMTVLNQTSDEFVMIKNFPRLYTVHAKVTIVTWTGAVHRVVGINMRRSLPLLTSGYACFASANASTTSQIVRYDNSIETVLASETATTWVVSDTIEFESKGGGDLTLYRNGSLLLTANDSRYKYGMVGINLWTPGTGALGNQELDDFSVWELGIEPNMTHFPKHKQREAYRRSYYDLRL